MAAIWELSVLTWLVREVFVDWADATDDLSELTCAVSVEFCDCAVAMDACNDATSVDTDASWVFGTYPNLNRNCPMAPGPGVPGLSAADELLVAGVSITVGSPPNVPTAW